MWPPVVQLEVSMKLLCMFLCVFCLSGCSAVPAWETVEDFAPDIPVSSWQSDTYAITVALPEDAQLIGETDTAQLYQAGDCEIETTTFLAADLNTAVKYLSGYESDRVTIIQTTRFDLPEYQFAWYTQTAEGGKLCRADVVMDDTVCYAVVCTAPEDVPFPEETRQVFATFGLSAPEPV